MDGTAHTQGSFGSNRVHARSDPTRDDGFSGTASFYFTEMREKVQRLICSQPVPVWRLTISVGSKDLLTQVPSEDS